MYTARKTLRSRTNLPRRLARFDFHLAEGANTSMSVFTNPASASTEQAAAYTQAILGLLDERDPLDVLRATASALSDAVAGMSEVALSSPEAPGKWSVRMVLRHLADSDLVWAWRLRMALAHDRPLITGYDQDAWADRLNYAGSDAGESLEEFEVVRRGNLRLIANAEPSDFERVGVHAERGEENVAHMVRLYAGHDLLHLRQIARIRSAVEARADGTDAAPSAQRRHAL
jgi:hypothetical protein